MVVVTASNHPELLDRAVWRRFQIRLELPMPKQGQIEKWFKRFENRSKHTLGLSPRSLAQRLKGLSFAEVEDFGTIHTRGTSYAAALASRWANFLLDVIEQLRSRPGADLPPEYVVLLKTLLVHGANWAEAGVLYETILKNPRNSRTFRDYGGRFLGYSSANVAKVMVCTDQRVTVLGVGKLDDGEGQEFFLPLPPSLSAVTEKRLLTVTLAWMTPVNSLRQNYFRRYFTRTMR